LKKGLFFSSRRLASQLQDALGMDILNIRIYDFTKGRNWDIGVWMIEILDHFSTFHSQFVCFSAI